MLNQQIQNYKIISLLGEGGMANVYLAQHQSLGNNVAVKLLKEEFVQHPNIRKRFLAEARNLAKMQHSNVIKVTDLIDAGDIVAFVMEYVEGVSLEDFISTHAPLSPETIEKLFLQMVVAIEYVHDQGLVHRDIKPSNFMVTPDESVKLLDFGIAKNLNDGAIDYTKTSIAQQMGTPMYMSPEQVRNTAEITPQTDIYSLGVVLWQMVMNKKPYDTERLTLPEIQVAIMKDPLPLTNTGWDEIIENLTEKNSWNRGSTLFIIDTLTKITALNELWDELVKGETSNPAEIVYEKEFKEIEKVVSEVTKNRLDRERKMKSKFFNEKQNNLTYNNNNFSFSVFFARLFLLIFFLLVMSIWFWF
jgi:serine/threonine protein kinase